MKNNSPLNSHNSNSSNDFSHSYSSTHFNQIIPSSTISLPNGRTKRQRQKENYTDIFKEKSNYQTNEITNPISHKRGKSESNRINNEFTLKNSSDSLRKSFDYNKIANHSASPSNSYNKKKINMKIFSKGEMQLSELNNNDSNFNSPSKNNIKSVRNLNKSNSKSSIMNNSNKREIDKNGIPICNSSTNILSKSSNNFSNYSNNYQKKENYDNQRNLNKSSSYKDSLSAKHKKNKSISFNKLDDNNINKKRSNSLMNPQNKQYIGIDMAMISNSSHPNNEHFNTQIHSLNNSYSKIRNSFDNEIKNSFIDQSNKLNDNNNYNTSNNINKNLNVNLISERNDYKKGYRNNKNQIENSQIFSPSIEKQIQSHQQNFNNNYLNNNNGNKYNNINNTNNNNSNTISNNNSSKFLDGLNQSSIHKNISRIQEDKISNIDISLSYKYQPNINSVNNSMRNGNSLSLNDLSTNRNDISNFSQSYTYQLDNNSFPQRNINSNRQNLNLIHMEKIRENPLKENLSSESMDENYKSKLSQSDSNKKKKSL